MGLATLLGGPLARFLKLVALAQRPGTPGEGQAALTALAAVYGQDYAVRWTMPKGTTVRWTTPTWNGERLVPQLNSGRLKADSTTGDSYRVKDAPAIALLQSSGFIWLKTSGSDFYIPLKDVKILTI